MDKDAVEKRMDKSVRSLSDEFVKIRSGRAHTGLLDQIKVPVYGQQMPIAQVATVAVGGHRLLTVTVWDKQNVAAVEKAIRDSDLGLNPSNDGSRVLVNLPELSEDRRVELVKVVKREAESARVAIRNIRRDEINTLRDQLKAKEIGENEMHASEKQLQTITDKKVQEIDKLAEAKSAELMQV